MLDFATLGKWIRDYGSKRSTSAEVIKDGEPLDAAVLAKENERLRIENRHLKEEREILKKATQFFAEISK